MNTKNLSPAERKAAKRSQRKDLKALYDGLSSKNKARFRSQEEGLGIKAFVASLEKEQAAE